MVFYATFINISVISWRSVLLLEETRIPRENQRPAQFYCWRKPEYLEKTNDLPSFIVGGNQIT